MARKNKSPFNRNFGFRKGTRFTAVALLVASVAGYAAQAAPPIVETDESVYINLDYYGTATDTRIVKGVNLNGHTEFTDYGDYNDVYNMSSFDEPDLSTVGEVKWKIDDNSIQRFYYECIPFGDVPITLPWEFDVSYKLNGVSVKAEQCAGANGLVEMNIKAVPNKAASTYYQNNMMLICATGIDMSKALSIDAPGAQIQSMGTYKLVVFMGMPGEENTFTVRIGSNNFESMGLILCMAPATLSSLDVLSDMKDVKDRLDTSGDALYEGLSSMLGTLDSMKSGLDTLSGGITGINEVRQKLIASRGELDPKTDAALDALEALAGKSDSLIPTLTQLKTTLSTLNTTTTGMLDTANQTTFDITEYENQLVKLYSDLEEMKNFFETARDYGDDVENFVDNLQVTVNAHSYSGDLNTFNNNLEDMQKELKDLSAASETLSTALTRLKSANDDIDLSTPVVNLPEIPPITDVPSFDSPSLPQLPTDGPVSDKINDHVGNINDHINNQVGNVNDSIEDYADDVNDYISDVNQELDNTEKDLDDLAEDLSATQKELSTVISDTGKLLDTVSSLTGEGGGLNDMLSTGQSISKEMDSIIKDAETLWDELDELLDFGGFDEYDTLPDEFAEDGQRLAELAVSTLESINNVLGELPALSSELTDLTSLANESIDKANDLTSAVTKTLETTSEALEQAKDTLRSVREQADTSTQQSVDGLLDVLQKAVRANSSSSLQNATDSIHQAVNDAEKDLEEDTNILNIDSSAELESVTSPLNPAPSSIQFILRTKEISVDELEEETESDGETEDEGVFARIKNIFTKLFEAITSVFSSDE